MSLGLEDLNKNRQRKTLKAKSTAAAPTVSGPAQQHPWAGKTKTARPWSDTNLAQSNTRGATKNSVLDTAMNEDWLTLHAAPLFYIDLEQTTWMIAMQEALVKIEDRIQSSVLKPLQNFRSFWFLS